MKSYSQSIMDYAVMHPIFGLQDLYAYYDGEANISRQTISWYLTKLTESGMLRRIGHGKYAIQAKQQFTITPTEEELKLNEELKQEWPYAHFCIYNGSCINPLQHHLAANNITYIETEREATSVVFNHLRDKGQTAYLRPTRELIYNYIDLSQPAIFVKPLITESPVQNSNGVLVPTLEKLLVDLQKDSDFFYMQEAEGTNIIRNALSLYTINENRLLRYAGRRGLKKEFETIIESINSND
ncbi:MAG: type IV toxin-antitoxin system AbiEi family antitoxin domain-containing protein [Bacteroidaceae bacterium]|nr:type IV toxin-antitoxin system AbiEi family antitoxin domain-containing protein [Bacteroidaceae bacterium]